MQKLAYLKANSIKKHLVNAHYLVGTMRSCAGKTKRNPMNF